MHNSSRVVKHYLLHDFLWAGATSHDTLTKAAQVILVEVRVSQLRYEHGGHAIQGCALLLLHCLQTAQSIQHHNRLHKPYLSPLNPYHTLTDTTQTD